MRPRFSILFALAILFGTTLPQSAIKASPAAQQPRDLTVLAGAGQDTVVLFAFFPRTISIRAGDTVTWKQNGEQGHTVAFLGPFAGPAEANTLSEPGLGVPANAIAGGNNPLRSQPFPGPEASGSIYRPGEFVSSGRFASIPQTPNLPELYTFSLIFDTPGTYSYICLLHESEMDGTVEVLDATAAKVLTPAEVDAQAQSEIASLLTLAELATPQRTASKREPGPNDSSVWFVSAGNNWVQVYDHRVKLLEFMPHDVTVTAGDSVVWSALGNHTVTFNPSPPNPPDVLPSTLPDGTPTFVGNRLARDPAKPAAVYDPTQWFNSGELNENRANGMAWMLTFEKPGTFEYYCAVHVEIGMKGTITVLAK